MCYVKTPGRDRNGGVLRSLPSTVWRLCPCQWNQTNDLYKKHTTLQSTRCFFYITSSYQALCSHYPLDLFILWFQMLACMVFSKKKNKKTKKKCTDGGKLSKSSDCKLKSRSFLQKRLYKSLPIQEGSQISFQKLSAYI